MVQSKRLARIRLFLGLFVTGLVVSGLTAFPLLTELNWLVRLRGVEGLSPEAASSGLDQWLLIVRSGLATTYERFPWMAYGTDWLAFAHLAIALFFVAPIIDPLRNISVLYAGVAACLFVLPIALICGAIRGIPFYWRLIDCSFAAFGALPLLYAIKLTWGLHKNATEPY